MTKEYSSPKLVRIDNIFYLISDKIFKLNNRDNDPLLPYAKQLSREDIEQLSVKIQYTGASTEFDCDEESFARIYTDILRDFNSLQAKQFVSFPLGNNYCQNRRVQIAFFFKNYGSI